MTTHRSSVSRLSQAAPLAAVAFALLTAAPAPAQDEDGVRQTVARVAYVSGNVAFSRGDDPDHWQDAVINVPLTLGDRLWTGKGARLELQAPGTRLFVAPETQLSILDLREDAFQFSLSVGTATVRLHHLGEGAIFEVDTPNTAVTIRTPGLYDVRVDEDGNTRVDVFEGSAIAAVGRDVAELRGGDVLRVRGTDAPVYEMEPLGAPDSWDRWVAERTRHGQSVVAARYVGGGVAGIEDLDSHGRWEQIPPYGWAWTPRTVVTGWAPYRDGRWIWQDPWGWTWVSREPWGWAPYHYGSWVSASGRWYWVPEGPAVRPVRYAPARVVFVGGGPGGAVVATGPAAYVGWFPVHPHDRFLPWWGSPAVVPGPHVTYGNRTHVTVVQRNAFVGGGYVRETHVRDAHLLREFSTAPVYHGPIPLVPTTSSLRFAPPSFHRELPRPPEKFLDRHVATSLPPPPRPPSFDTKVDVIREGHGRPYHQPDVVRPAPERTHETRGTAAGPRPETRDLTRPRTDARPTKEYAGPKATPFPGTKKYEDERPYHPEGYQQRQYPTKAPTRPPDKAVKAPTPAAKVSGPAAKDLDAFESYSKGRKPPPEKIHEPTDGSLKTQKGPPDKVHAPMEGSAKTQRTAVPEKPRTSTAPKPPPEKKHLADKPDS